MQMIEVTKEEFFAKVGPLDVIPRANRNETIWETRQRVVVGRSTPGYLCEGPKAWLLTKRDSDAY